MTKTHLKRIFLGTFLAITPILTLQALAVWPNVGQIDLDFCNEGSTGNQLHLQMDMGTSTGICMQLKNDSTLPAMLQFSFVDGEMAQWEPPVQACKTSAHGIFWKNTTLSGDAVFTLQPGESTIKTGEITIPTWYAGDLYGCATFVLVDEQTQEGGLSIVSRKANLISIAVSWEVIQDFTVGNLTLVEKKDKAVTMNFNATNKGTVSENISISYVLTSNLWYREEKQLVSNQMIYWGDTQEFSITTNDLPWYWGKYTLQVNVDHQAVVGWEEGTIQRLEKSTSFNRWIFVYRMGVFWWEYILVSILALLILLLIKRRKNKKTQQNIAIVGDNITAPAPSKQKPTYKKFKKRPMPQ